MIVAMRMWPALLLGCGGPSAGEPDGWMIPATAVPGDDEVPAGTSANGCTEPARAALQDVSSPTSVVGTGTPESCTAEAFVAAVARGGVVTFDCGSAPSTITLTEPAKVRNDASSDVVIDGGGKVTLSGGGTTRILYMNTCDEAQVFTSPHCDNQETPRLTVQNITFANGYAGPSEVFDGGGAIWARGGTLTILDSRFFANRCVEQGPDVGGGAVRARRQGGRCARAEDREERRHDAARPAGPAHSHR